MAVVDLGFGDSGKGLIVDALARASGPCLIVRFNGGSQAGHNVLAPDGRHHTFSQFGAGTFVPGVRTFLSRKVVVHPTALLLEAAALAEKGVPDALARLAVSREALVVSPYQQALGRLRELARGEARHGSCGVGFGEVVSDSLDSTAPVLRMGDLADRTRAKRVLSQMREAKRAAMAALALGGEAPILQERRVVEDPGIADAWLDRVARLARSAIVVEDGYLARREGAGDAIIFEGAQGVLIDEVHGCAPHTTWSDCTYGGAEALLAGKRRLERIGVLRTHLVRHGAGPFPTEDDALASKVSERHNADGPWQGRVRFGWPDWALMRYAIDACGRVDGLALTHLDLLDGAREWKTAVGPRSPRRAFLDAPVYRAWALPGGESAGDAYAALVEEAARVPVLMSSRGPAASHVSLSRVR